MQRTIMGAAGALLLTLAMSACSAQSQADYPFYASLDEIAAASVDVVEVTVGTSSDDTLYSQEIGGDDPVSNPSLGVDDADQSFSEDTGIDVIIYETRVQATYKGSTVPGDVVEVHQVRNEAGGIPLEEGRTYLLFLLSADGYPSGIVGGTQGQFLVTEAGYQPTATETIPNFTASDLAAISN